MNIDELYEQVILEWDKLDKTEKLKRLQAYEHANSILFGRTEREIRLNRGNDTSSYDGNNPMLINISREDSCEMGNEALFKLAEVFHEGFHAFLHDCCINKAELKSYASIDMDHLVGKQAYIHYRASLSLYDLSFDKDMIRSHYNYIDSYEERYVRRETMINSTHRLLKILKDHHLNTMQEKSLLVVFFDLVADYLTYLIYMDEFEFKDAHDFLICQYSSLYSDRDFEEIKNSPLYKEMNFYPDSDKISRPSDECLARSRKLFGKIPTKYVSDTTQNLIDKVNDDIGIDPIIRYLYESAENLPTL